LLLRKKVLLKRRKNSKKGIIERELLVKDAGMHGISDVQEAAPEPHKLIARNRNIDKIPCRIR
jgi:hypothetical protein